MLLYNTIQFIEVEKEESWNERRKREGTGEPKNLRERLKEREEESKRLDDNLSCVLLDDNLSCVVVID